MKPPTAPAILPPKKAPPTHLERPHKVLSLDPGWSKFGWAVFVDGQPYQWGTRSRPRSRTYMSLPAHVQRDRMLFGVMGIDTICAVLVDPTTMVVIEDVNEHLHDDPRTGKPKGTAGLIAASRMIGHVESFICRRSNPVFFAPRRVWAGVKTDAFVMHEMQLLVGRRLTQDEADALGLGHWFCAHKWFELRHAKEQE